MNSLRDLPDEDFFNGNAFMCKGCGSSIALKLALKAFGKDTIVINSSDFYYLRASKTFTPFKVPALQIDEKPCEAAAAIHTALKENVIVFTNKESDFSDILSAAKRNKRITCLFCKDTLDISENRAKMLSEFSYAATASLAHPVDFMRKLYKAKQNTTFSYIEVLTPCPHAWQYDPSKTIELSNSAVESAFWPIYEYESKKLHINHKPHQLQSIKSLVNDSEMQHAVTKRYHNLLREENEGVL